MTKYIGTSSTHSAKRSKPKPGSNTTAGMPVRAWSVSVQTWPRMLRKPFGLPSVKGELANSAVATGCRASEMRSFSTMSASSPKVEIGLHRAGPQHHVEAEPPTFGM